MKRSYLVASAGLVVLTLIVASALIWLSDTSAQQPFLMSGSDQVVVEPGGYPSKLMTQPSVELPEDMPASLEGTEVPEGWAQTDANGSLVPTPHLRRLFEYYLAALGEETLAQLVTRIERSLAQLPEPARTEAMVTLGQYLDYKLELGQLEASVSTQSGSLSPEAMARQLSEVRALRRRWLDAKTAEAFFASEEAVDDFQLAQLRIQSDDSLTDEERASRLREAEQILPEPIREARQETRKFSEYQQQRQALADDPEALANLRRQTFGEEAARRVAEAEQEQQEWDARWQEYQAERARLENQGLAGPELESAITRLRESYFDGSERIRAEALDSIR